MKPTPRKKCPSMLTNSFPSELHTMYMYSSVYLFHGKPPEPLHMYVCTNVFYQGAAIQDKYRHSHLKVMYVHMYMPKPLTLVPSRVFL
jgi:hypothetical protein